MFVSVLLANGPFSVNNYPLSVYRADGVNHVCAAIKGIVGVRDVH